MDDGVFGVFVTNAESGAGSTIGSWSFGLGCFLPDFLSTLLRVFFEKKMYTGPAGKHQYLKRSFTSTLTQYKKTDHHAATIFQTYPIFIFPLKR
jgi:hypothetical protein